MDDDFTDSSTHVTGDAYVGVYGSDYNFRHSVAPTVMVRCTVSHSDWPS